MSDFIAHVIAELDTSKAQSALNAFTKGKHTIDVDVNLTSKNGNVNNILNQIKSQFQSAGTTAGQGFANNVNTSLNSINVKNAASQIANLQRTLKSMNFSSPSIDTITKDLQEMDIAVSKVTTRMNGQNLNVRVDGIDQMGRAVTVVKEFDAATGRMQRTSETVATSMKTMFSGADASKLSASISALDANFVKLKGSVSSESTALAKLKTDLANISNINGLERQQAEFERITAEVDKLSVSYKKAYAENQALVASQQLLSNKTILGNQIETWMSKNTKASKIYRTELESLQKQLATVGNASELKAVSSQFAQLKTNAAAAGNLGNSAFGTLMNNVTKLSPLFGMGTMVMTSINGIKSMISTVVDLDTALVDLKKTTTMSNSELESFYGDANKTAIEMGVSTEEIINQASAWSRLGYSSADAASKMAKLSSQFASISPGMDVDTATDGLVSIMKAYDIDVDNVLDGVMSKINIIGNTAATSNSEIVEMLSRSSSAMHEANNSLEETIALETAAVEITRDPASVGTAFKTVAMRIRGYDEETESYTNDVEVLSGKIADLTKTASTPGGISLFTDETKTEYKSTYQLLEEISGIYDQLTDKDQAGLLEALAGKRQGQIIAATITNFDAAKKAMDNMSESAGSADKEMGIIMDSLEYKLNALKETGTGIAQNLFQKDDMKAVVDGLTGILTIIEKLTDSLGLFGTIGLGTGLFQLFKNRSYFSTLGSALADSTKSFSNFGAAAKMAGTDLLSFMKTPAGIATGIGLATAAIGLAVNAYKNYKQELREANEEQLSTAQAAIETADSFEEAYISASEYAGKDNLTASEEESLASAVESANTALGNKAIAFDTASGSADSYISKLQEVAGEELNQAKINATKERQAAENLLKDDSYDWFWGSNATIDMSGRTGIDEFVKAKEVVNDLMGAYVDLGQNGEELEPLNWDKDHTNMDALVDYYYNLVNLTDELADKQLTNNDIYDDATKQVNELTEDVESYVKAKYDEAKYTYEATNGIPTKLEEYEAMRNALIDNTDASQAYKDAMSGIMSTDFEGVFDVSAVEDGTSSIVSYAEAIDALKAKLEEFKTYQSNVNSALSDSKSATGLTTEEIDNLIAAYKDLDGYDPAKLFEQTANGVHLNADELQKLNEQYQSKTIEDYAKNIKDIQASIYSERAKGNDTSGLEDELQQAKLLQSQYEGLTSAYNNWLSAKSGGNERDSYESIGSSYKDMQETLNEGWYGDESLNAYLDLLLSAQQRTGDAAADFDKLNQTIEGTSHSIMDYWKYDENDNLVTDGLFDFLDDVNTKMGDEFAKVNENGQYEFDFDGDKLQQVADEFGMSTEAVELFERAMIDAGMAVDLSDQGIVEQVNSATESLKKFQEAGQLSSDLDLDFNVDTDSLEDIRGNIDALKNERINIDAEANPELAAELDNLIAKCEQQYYFRLNAETDGSLDSAISIVEQMKSLTAAPLTVEARTANAGEIATLAAQLAALPPEVQIAVGITTENVGNVEGIINQLNTQPESIQVPVNYEKGSEPESVDDAKGTANYDLGTSPTTVPDANGTANFSLGSYPTSLPSITQNVIANKIGFAAGTAHADGTFNKMYNAYAQGKDWSLPRNENALVNEVGTESIVRDGKWIPLQGGAHIAQLKKGDIVFSAAQTEELIRTGKIISGGGHGRIAMADGTAYNTLNINAYDSGSGGNRRPNSGQSTSLSNSSSASSNSSYSAPSSGSSGASSRSYSSSSSSSDEEKDKFEETVDFVEIAIKRITEAVDRLKIKAESVYNTLSKRNTAASDEIAMITKQIDIQNQAYTKYMQQANAVGLSETYAAKIRDGSIDVSLITDEDLSDKIKDYQDFYEKAIEAKDAVAELHEEIASLYSDRFDNIATDYENQIALIEHLSNTYQTGLDTLEAKGLKGSTVYYKSLEDLEKDRKSALNDELTDLTKSFEQAMASGEIEKYSEQWYEFQKDMNSVREEIDDCNLSLLEFEKNLRELNWEYFDYMQERISSITDEADFLIDLMSNGDLFDDKGFMTDTGMATMGLHGQNYNVYMSQADQYAEEIKKINADLAKDPYNTDLIERREELLGLQRDSIKSAEEEKQAIVDLVQDGIDAQLDSMKELIDAYTESLDSAKDLYDYQKKVKQQTAEIASLQKQLSAYQNDTSEENRAHIQKIEVDLSKAMEELQETEYEQYITDQKKLLDELQTEYETVLNQRLDDVDALISETIDTINASSGAISDTLITQADNVGYTLTESMKAIWSNEGGANSIITKYGDGFTSQLTAINASINGIKLYTDGLKAQADAEAAAKKAAAEAAAKKQAEAEAAKKQQQQNPAPSNGTQGDGQIQVGDRVTFTNGNYYNSSDGGRPTGHQYMGSQVYVTKINTASWASHPYHISTGSTLGNGDLGWLTRSQISGYSTGAYNLNKDENAWTNELGTEGIIRPTESAIMTPLAKGDSVLKAEATKNIWDMANDPAGFINGNLFTNGVVSSGTNAGDQFVSSIDTVEFVLPSVTNYEDLMNTARKDPKFEKMVQAFTVNRLSGGSRISKNKFEW